MANVLERVDAGTAAGELAALLRRDGAAIVTGALSPRQLAAINAEVTTPSRPPPPACAIPPPTFSSNSTAAAPSGWTACRRDRRPFWS